MVIPAIDTAGAAVDRGRFCDASSYPPNPEGLALGELLGLPIIFDHCSYRLDGFL
jgi:hypothetical protein